MLATGCNGRPRRGDTATLDAAVALARERFGRLDIVVANAGQAYAAPVIDEPMNRLRTLIEVNLTSVISLARAAGPALLNSAPGSTMIIVASIYGLIGVGDGPMAGYPAT